MYKWLNFKCHIDPRGKLVPVEYEKDIPFKIKRLFWIYETDRDVLRGCHAHKKSKEVIVCLSGSCDFILDNGKERQIIHLSDPSKGLYLEPSVWREFTNFSENCVLLVISNLSYKESDYIRDYKKFIKEMSND